MQITVKLSHPVLCLGALLTIEVAQASLVWRERLSLLKEANLCGVFVLRVYLWGTGGPQSLPQNAYLCVCMYVNLWLISTSSLFSRQPLDGTITWTCLYLRTWSSLTMWIEWQLIAFRTWQIARPFERVVPSTCLSTQNSSVKAEYCEARVRSACASRCHQTTQRGTALGTFCSSIEGLDRSMKAYIGTCYPFTGSFSLAHSRLKCGPEWRLIRGTVLVILSWAMA